MKEKEIQTMFYIFDKSAGTLDECETVGDVQAVIAKIFQDSGNDSDWMLSNVKVIQGEYRELSCKIEMKLDDIKII